jgi:hypothetical protein
VEAGKNTSTVIPASRKRRRKGKPVVSGKTVMYGYESSTTLTTDRLHYKLQTRPLVRAGAPKRRAKQFSGIRKEEVKSRHGPQGGARHQDIRTDWPVSRKVTSTPTIHSYAQQHHMSDGAWTGKLSLYYAYFTIDITNTVSKSMVY